MYVCLCNGINIDPTVKLADNRAGPKERQREKAKEDEDEDEARVPPTPAFPSQKRKNQENGVEKESRTTLRG